MGKKNLERALVAAKPRLVSKDTTFTTTWRPFFLIPPDTWSRGVASGEFPADAETVGINKLDYYHSKFGGPARVTPMIERLSGILKTLDVEYNMDGNTGPTLDGHRIATYAERVEGIDKQNAFMEEIFKSYFTKAEAPCDVKVLRSAAKNAGLDMEAVENVLATPTAELGEIDEQMQKFARGVSGVPYFILSDGKRRIRMSGAQPPEQFLDALEQLGAIDDA